MDLSMTRRSCANGCLNYTIKMADRIQACYCCSSGRWRTLSARCTQGEEESTPYNRAKYSDVRQISTTSNGICLWLVCKCFSLTKCKVDINIRLGSGAWSYVRLHSLSCEILLMFILDKWDTISLSSGPDGRYNRSLHHCARSGIISLAYWLSESCAACILDRIGAKSTPDISRPQTGMT